jgi:hypothetical protein
VKTASLIRTFLILSALLATSCRGAESSKANRPSTPSPQVVLDVRPRSAATTDLVDLLRANLYRGGQIGDGGYVYWSEHDYDSFWLRVQRAIEAGADTAEACRDGADVWRAALHTDTRCMCAPFGWPGSDTSKCNNPKYYPGCSDHDLVVIEKRIAYLLAHGVDPNQAEPPPPICQAVNWGTLDSVKQLFAGKAKCPADCDGTTLLHHASNSYARLCLVLRACGNKIINAQDSDGRTPLLEAVELGNARTASVFLDYGADPEITDHRGRNAADMARLQRKPAIARLLKRWSAGGQPTLTACPP